MRQAYQTGIQFDFDLHSEKNLYRPYTKANLIDLSDLVTGQQRQFLLQTFLIRLKLHKAMTGQSWGPGWNHNYGQSAKL